MKKTLLIVLFLRLSMITFAQCSLTIQPQGPTTFCSGDSVQLIASAIGPGSVIDQKDTVYNAGTSARNLPGYSIWQSFTAGITGILTQVDLGFFNFINGTGTLSIYAVTGTGGTLLNTHSVNVNCPSGNCLLGFTESIPVVAGNVYTFHFIPGTGIPDPYGVQVDLPGTYAGGTFALVDPSGTYPGWDMVFKTHVGTALHYHWSTGGTDSILEVHSSGMYHITVTDSASCTRIDSIQVTVNSVDTSVHITGVTLNANATSATYQWVNCSNNYSFISGATNQSFTPSSNGHYAVIVTKNGCTDTSNCRNIFSVGMPAITSPSNAVAFPNPTSGKLTINTGNLAGSKCTVEIINAIGKVVYASQQNSKQSTVDIDVSKIPSGVYLLKIIDENAVHTSRIVIQ